MGKFYHPEVICVVDRMLNTVTNNWHVAAIFLGPKSACLGCFCFVYLGNTFKFHKHCTLITVELLSVVHWNNMSEQYMTTSSAELYAFTTVWLSHHSTVWLSHHSTVWLSHHSTVSLSHHSTVSLSHHSTFSNPLDLFPTSQQVSRITRLQFWGLDMTEHLFFPVDWGLLR